MMSANTIIPAGKSVLKVGAFTDAPPPICAFHSFDPESFIAIALINDALVYLDPEGKVAPALATSWELLNPTTLEFKLRKGVFFHNGEYFDARSVKATYEVHLNPDLKSARAIMWQSVKSCTIIDDETVRFETHFPNAMLLNSFAMSQIYPASLCNKEGLGKLLGHPVGTGAYEFVSNTSEFGLILKKNPQHWACQSIADYIQMPFIKAKLWHSKLLSNELDVCINIDTVDALLLEKVPGFKVETRLASISQWFLLSNKGPLSDIRVRKAMAHALQPGQLLKAAQNGLGRTQTGIGTPQDVGFNNQLKPYHYEPEESRRLLSEAGYPNGFKLKGLVSDTSTVLFALCREFLSRIGITLEGQIVSRTEWLYQIILSRMMGQRIFEGDFAVNMIDNPVMHALFHHANFVFSKGLGSLTNDEEYDKRLMAAMADMSTDRCLIKSLEEYVHDQCLFLPTVQTHAGYAARDGIYMPINASGHFNSESFWKIDIQCKLTSTLTTSSHDDHVEAGSALTSDLEQIRLATGHRSLFYPEELKLSDPRANTLWSQLITHQKRFHRQTAPLISALVDNAEATERLANVLRSTNQIGLVAFSLSGRAVFNNDAFEATVGVAPADLPLSLKFDEENMESWPYLLSRIQTDRAFSGPVNVLCGKIKRRLFLSATYSMSDVGTVNGYLMVFSDYSGEEEKVRSKAVRSIMENVDVGLFLCNSKGQILEGYSKSCEYLLGRKDLTGNSIFDIFKMSDRDLTNYQALYEQIFELPFLAEMSCKQLPKRLAGHMDGRVFDVTVRATESAEDNLVLLFNLVDCSAEVAAQQKIDEIQAVLKILELPSQFANFEASFKEKTKILRGLALSPGNNKSTIKGILHTLKGNSSFFYLSRLSAFIHDIESQENCALEDIAGLENLLAGFLDRHSEALGRSEGGSSPKVTLLEGEMESLKKLSTQGNVSELKAFIDSLDGILLSEACEPLRQLTERLCKKLGKKSRFVLESKEMRLPKHLNPILETLTHLLRNAVDHGIEESPELRLQRGKNATAEIKLSVELTKHNAVIRFSDDGQGINRKRILEKAIETGMIDSEKVAALTDEQVLNLVLHPGLSTADAVTDISGRGAGSGEFERVVHELGGDLRIESESGKGTTFIACLPLKAGYAHARAPQPKAS